MCGIQISQGDSGIKKKLSKKVLVKGEMIKKFEKYFSIGNF